MLKGEGRWKEQQNSKEQNQETLYQKNIIMIKNRSRELDICMPVISALRKLRQESQEFKSSLGHRVIRASLNHIPMSKRKRKGRAWEEMGIGLSLHNFLHEDCQSLCRARKKLCDFE